MTTDSARTPESGSVPTHEVEPGEPGGTPAVTFPAAAPRPWGRGTAFAVGVVLLWALGVGFATGARGGLSAALGGTVVVLVLAATPLILGPLLRAVPGAAMVAAMLFFAIKTVVLAVLLVALSLQGVQRTLDTGAAGWAGLIGASVWLAVATVLVLWPRREAASAVDATTSDPRGAAGERLIASASEGTGSDRG